MCVRVYESVCMFVSANVGVSVRKYEAVHQCKHVSEHEHEHVCEFVCEMCMHECMNVVMHRNVCMSVQEHAHT